MKRYCLTLHLKNDPALISEYEEHHKKVWPEIVASIRDSGIISMQIYRYGTAMFMIMETEDEFSFERKQQADMKNDKVQQWEELMWKYQQPFAEAAPGEKWMLMNKIFDLEDF
jgi:L-rhamnose mutarotase